MTTLKTIESEHLFFFFFLRSCSSGGRGCTGISESFLGSRRLKEGERERREGKGREVSSGQEADARETVVSQPETVVNTHFVGLGFSLVTSLVSCGHIFVRLKRREGERERDRKKRSIRRRRKRARTEKYKENL